MDLRSIDLLALSFFLHGEREPLAERDVAGRILVQQGVVEDRAELADPALAVDQRHLSEPGCAAVALRKPAEGLAALVGIDLHRAPVLKLHLYPGDQPPRAKERFGRADHA